MQAIPSAEQAYILLVHCMSALTFHHLSLSLSAQLQVHQVSPNIYQELSCVNTEYVKEYVKLSTNKIYKNL